MKTVITVYKTTLAIDGRTYIYHIHISTAWPNFCIPVAQNSPHTEYFSNSLMPPTALDMKCKK